jgi:hypothetical protein
VAIAALTSIGTEFSKTWLPSFASCTWNYVTSSKLVFVTVLRDERLTPISKAVVKAVDPNPTQKTTFDEATTDDDGRAVLDKVRVRNFLLRVTYAEGSKLYTYLTDVTVDKWPHRMKIAEKTGWISHDIETSTAKLADAASTANGTEYAQMAGDRAQGGWREGAAWASG